VRPDQLDTTLPRHADGWVRSIEADQIDRYALLFDLIVQRIQLFDRDPGDTMVEVLSTCPRPLAEVLSRYRLGRYRVTQKANLNDAHDVYRSDAAHPQDWIMVGNHDTPPLRAVLDKWHDTGELPRRVDYLANRLAAHPRERQSLTARLTQNRKALATAMFADLLCTRARNVLIFWVDLFGLRETYNRPGVIDGNNWSMRVPADFERVYAAARDNGDAPNLAESIAWALHARGLDRDPDGQAIVETLAGPGPISDS
jgi:4-alpha-glucanotransferase